MIIAKTNTKLPTSEDFNIISPLHPKSTFNVDDHFKCWAS